MDNTTLVIKIPTELYSLIQNKLDFNGDLKKQDIKTLMLAIDNGIQLPKGHGQLKDADAMINKLCTHEASELFGSTTCAEILDFINDEKPIIEADRSEK